MISKSEVVLCNLISPRLAYFVFTIWYSKTKAATELRNLEIWEFQFHCKFEAGKPQQKNFTKSLQYIAYKMGRQQSERLSSTTKLIFAGMNLYPQSIKHACFPWSFRRKEDRRSENSSRKSRTDGSCSKQKGCNLLLYCLRKRTVQFPASHLKSRSME